MERQAIVQRLDHHTLNQHTFTIFFSYRMKNYIYKSRLSLVYQRL